MLFVLDPPSGLRKTPPTVGRSLLFPNHCHQTDFRRPMGIHRRPFHVSINAFQGETNLYSFGWFTSRPVPPARGSVPDRNTSKRNFSHPRSVASLRHRCLLSDKHKTSRNKNTVVGTVERAICILHKEYVRCALLDPPSMIRGPRGFTTDERRLWIGC